MGSSFDLKKLGVLGVIVLIVSIYGPLSDFRSSSRNEKKAEINSQCFEYLQSISKNSHKPDLATVVKFSEKCGEDNFFLQYNLALLNEEPIPEKIKFYQTLLDQLQQNGLGSNELRSKILYQIGYLQEAVNPNFSVESYRRALTLDPNNKYAAFRNLIGVGEYVEESICNDANKYIAEANFNTNDPLYEIAQLIIPYRCDEGVKRKEKFTKQDASILHHDIFEITQRISGAERANMLIEVALSDLLLNGKTQLSDRVFARYPDCSGIDEPLTISNCYILKYTVAYKSNDFENADVIFNKAMEKLENSHAHQDIINLENQYINNKEKISDEKYKLKWPEAERRLKHALKHARLSENQYSQIQVLGRLDWWLRYAKQDITADNFVYEKIQLEEKVLERNEYLSSVRQYIGLIEKKDGGETALAIAQEIYGLVWEEQIPDIVEASFRSNFLQTLGKLENKYGNKEKGSFFLNKANDEYELLYLKSIDEFEASTGKRLSSTDLLIRTIERDSNLSLRIKILNTDIKYLKRDNNSTSVQKVKHRLYDMETVSMALTDKEWLSYFSSEQIDAFDKKLSTRYFNTVNFIAMQENLLDEEKFNFSTDALRFRMRSFLTTSKLRTNDLSEDDKHQYWLKMFYVWQNLIANEMKIVCDNWNIETTYEFHNMASAISNYSNSLVSEKRTRDKFISSLSKIKIFTKYYITYFVAAPVKDSQIVQVHKINNKGEFSPSFKHESNEFHVLPAQKQIWADILDLYILTNNLRNVTSVFNDQNQLLKTVYAVQLLSEYGKYTDLSVYKKVIALNDVILERLRGVNNKYNYQNLDLPHDLYFYFYYEAISQGAINCKKAETLRLVAEFQERFPDQRDNIVKLDKFMSKYVFSKDAIDHQSCGDRAFIYKIPDVTYNTRDTITKPK